MVTYEAVEDLSDHNNSSSNASNNNNNATPHWKSFVASSHAIKSTSIAGGNNNNTSGQLGLQRALFSNNGNSAVVSPPKQTAEQNHSSFFITKKDHLLGSPSPDGKQKLRNVVQQQSPVSKMRDVALKHLFQPELVAAAAGTTSTSEMKGASSFGVTPLKTAPLRMGVRKRLGVALLNQKSSSSSRQNSPDYDENNREENQHHSHPEVADVLRYVGNRVLLMKPDSQNPIPQINASKKAQAAPNQSPPPPLLSPPKQQSVDKLPSPKSAKMKVEQPLEDQYEQNDGYNKDTADQNDSFSFVNRHIEEAANRARQLSYAELYEESIERERKQKEEEQKRLESDDCYKQELLRLQREQEELERQKIYGDVPAEEFEVRGNNKKSRQFDASPSTQQQVPHHDQQRQQTNATEQPKMQKKKQPSEITGDFKAPLTTARQALQSSYQTLESEYGIPSTQVATAAKFQNNKDPESRQLASAVHHLEGKYEMLSAVGNKIEQEEHRMRLATATILAEILALKKLEDASKNEALSWIEYADDCYQQQQEQQGGNNNNSEVDLDEKLREAIVASEAAKTFLMDLE